MAAPYLRLGETPRAIEHHENALAIQREIGDRRGEANALGNLGNAYASLGQTGRAIEHCEKALVILREISDRPGECMVLWNMSLMLDTLGDRTKAIENAEASLKIRERSRTPTPRRSESNSTSGETADQPGPPIPMICHSEPFAAAISGEKGEESAVPSAATARPVFKLWSLTFWLRE